MNARNMGLILLRVKSRSGFGVKLWRGLSELLFFANTRLQNRTE